MGLHVEMPGCLRVQTLGDKPDAFLRIHNLLDHVYGIGLYVFDLRCGVFKGVQNIGRVLKPQPSETGLHLWRGYGLAADLQVRGCTAQHMADQLQNTVRVVVHVGHGQQGVVDLLPHRLYHFLCL